MKVVVLGSGIVGITSAYQLARNGHEVTVLDRQAGPALETSFANAGQVSFGYCSPWAAPGIPLKALKWLLMEHSPLVIRPRLDAAMLTWLLQMLRNCTAERYAINKSRMLRLADYSRVAFRHLRDETGIAYDHGMKGTLQLFRTQQQLDASAKDAKVLAADGIAFEILGPNACVAVEPALAHARHKVAGGLRTPGDETGDCYKFASALAARAEALGVRFAYNSRVTGLDIVDGKVAGVLIEGKERIAADAVVVALGSFSAAFLRPYKINLPIYPVKGYSLTIPIRDPSKAPISTVMDESYKIAITRLGDRIRVGGTAEISGYTNGLDAGRRKTLEHSVSDLFPGGDLAKATFWSGLRPMTPDGTPIVGATRIPRLFLNTGHGTLGWTMSSGSARIVSDLVSGETPEIDVADLGVARYALR
ncbi:D-amino acid dehydrogenase [Pelagibacterium lacus]|uniref:D-amino acid dehydrogenase n=1 Tax=Pelagibacterium lacus TaxID=2282655 RepID=A0A369VZA7_9HYPH|nr:D-amino acid dehydrogenase [Pelagibacterium lacus]RDE07734.1 D-amino acid dehydrogenase [Pelagibacterium lacus]